MARSYHSPTSVEQACRLLSEDPWGAKVLAGGTAVVLMMQHGLIEPDALVSLRHIDALRGIGSSDGTLRIGATTTLTEVAMSPEVVALAPSLAAACGQVGNPRVRNVATLGGNLAEADYASDPPSVLASLDAQCHVRGPSSSRTVPAADFVTGFYENALDDDELLTHVDVPVAVEGRRSVYLKYRSRSSEDRACVGVAARADVREGSVAQLDVVVAAVASTPQRVPVALDSAVGRRLDTPLAAAVASSYAESIEPMEDARGSRWYRRRMIGVFVRRAVEALAGEPAAVGKPMHG